MNFDIKYATYLQIFNFIKIKQVLGVFLGTQNWRSIAKILNWLGCILGMTNKSTDRVGPISQRQREKEKRKERMQSVQRKSDKWDPCSSDTSLRETGAYK